MKMNKDDDPGTTVREGEEIYQTKKRFMLLFL